MQEKDIVMQITMNGMIIGMCWKWLEVCRLFKPTRHMAQYFIYVIYGLIPYFIILAIMVFASTLLSYMNKPEAPRSALKYDKYLETFFSEYQLIFGENIDHQDSTGFQILLYVAFTLLINIVNMNLLIAIITIQLEALLASQNARDVESQIDIFITYNCTLNTIRSF